MAKIFWDTNLFIYLFEANPRYVDRVVELGEAIATRGDQLCTSCLTVGEILSKPMAHDRADLVERYHSFFQHPNLTVIPFDFAAAFHFARIRKDTAIRPPDAIQLACAAKLEVDLFITNDERLSKRSVKGIHFITSLDRAPL